MPRTHCSATTRCASITSALPAAATRLPSPTARMLCRSRSAKTPACTCSPAAAARPSAPSSCTNTKHAACACSPSATSQENCIFTEPSASKSHAHPPCSTPPCSARQNSPTAPTPPRLPPCKPPGQHLPTAAPNAAPTATPRLPLPAPTADKPPHKAPTAGN